MQGIFRNITEKSGIKRCSRFSVILLKPHLYQCEKTHFPYNYRQASCHVPNLPVLGAGAVVKLW